MDGSSRTTSAEFKNYYEILRVRPYDSTELIQAAFLAQIKQCHPDRFAMSDPEDRIWAEHHTKLVIEARNCLCDSRKKAAYDHEFSIRYPRRFEKLSTKERPTERQINIEDLLNTGIPRSERLKGPDQPFKFRRFDFSIRVNRTTKQAIFNATHFLESNPECEVRFRFNYNKAWTEFSRKHVHRVQYEHGKVAMAEMQARYVDSNGKTRYSKPMMKVVILSPDFREAFAEKISILGRLQQQKNRMAYKLVGAIVGMGVLAVHAMLGIWIA